MRLCILETVYLKIRVLPTFNVYSQKREQPQTLKWSRC